MYILPAIDITIGKKSRGPETKRLVINCWSRRPMTSLLVSGPLFFTNRKLIAGSMYIHITTFPITDNQYLLHNK